MHSSLWQNILSSISGSIDEHRFETWFRPLVLNCSNDINTLSLSAPNQFISDFLDQNYKNMILSIAQNFSKDIKNVTFTVGSLPSHLSDEKLKKLTPSTTSESSSSFPQLNKRFTLDTFVVGPGNQFARSAALAVAEAPGKTKFNPLLIYGGVGLGKTHLLQSIGNYVLSYSSKYVVTYITSEEFYLNFIDAIKNNNTKILLPFSLL